MGKIVIKHKSRLHYIDFRNVVESLKRIYLATRERNLRSALVFVMNGTFRSLKKVSDDELFVDAGFVQKLLQFDASGYVKPPLNLGTLYLKVADKIEEKIKRIKGGR